jgi:hypothetical protein
MITKSLQTLRKGISTMDEDGVIGKDEVVMQVCMDYHLFNLLLPATRLSFLRTFYFLGIYIKAIADLESWCPSSQVLERRGCNLQFRKVFLLRQLKALFVGCF